MKFKADCSFSSVGRYISSQLYGSSMSWFVSGFRLNNHVCGVYTYWLLIKYAHD